jgi:Cu2+-containing amine oxidase
LPGGWLFFVFFLPERWRLIEDTGTTHVARAEEWPIMPTEWVHTLLKPWNFFDETPQ